MPAATYVPKVGDLVGAGRWPGALPYQPWLWGPPWAGRVLDRRDPEAWRGTLAFPYGDPDPEAVRKHVDWVDTQEFEEKTVPVLWDFGDKKKVYWEKLGTGEHCVRPYKQDYDRWKRAHQAAVERTDAITAESVSVRIVKA